MLVMQIVNEKDSGTARDSVRALSRMPGFVAGSVIEVLRGGAPLYEVRTIFDCPPSGTLQPGQRRVLHFVLPGRAEIT